jgi:hypothetical protein
MTGIPVDVACQLGDCRNRAALTVTVELPTSWTESREYTTRTLQVAVCGDCAAALEADAKALLEGRTLLARRLQSTADYANLMRLLLALIDAVGAPYEPEQGSTFATWLAKLDKPRAQSAWRLLAFVKRQTLEGKTVRGGWWRKARRARGESPADGRRDRIADRPLSIDDARFRRRALERPSAPPQGDPSPPVPFPPRGGDDAA